MPSYLQNSTINNTISWTQRDTSNNEVTVIDQGQIDYEQLFPSGTGTAQNSAVFYTSGTITASQSLTFDLFNLSRSVFGSTLISNFSGGKIKVLNVENLTSGYILTFLTTGTSAFSGTLLGGSGLNIYPQSYISMINLSGWSISPSRYFYLRNPNNTGINYQISILGNTL